MAQNAFNTDYLIKLSNKALDEKMRMTLDLLFHTVNDIERDR